MVEYIEWDLPSDGTQIELRYDDTAPVHGLVKEMLQCKIDPRATPPCSGRSGGDPEDTADLVIAPA